MQSQSIVLFAPSSSPTPSVTVSPSATLTTSATSTVTGSNTGSPSPSQTPSPTSTISGGVSPSLTASPSATASTTASTSLSATPTATASSSPLSSLPANVRVDLAAASCLNFWEIFCISPDYRVVTSVQAGGVARLSSVHNPAWGEAPVNDGWLGAPAPLVHASCIANQWADITFPPTRVVECTLVNRMDGGFNSRMSGAILKLSAQNGSTIMPRATLNINYVQTVAVPGAAYGAPPALPDPASPEQTSSEGRLARPRFVRIQAPPSAALTVKEVFVLDANMQNRAVGRPVSATGTLVRGSGPGAVTDGVYGDVDLMASASVAAFNSTPGVAASLTIDLGALFELSAVWLFMDKFQPPMVAHSLVILNFYGDAIGNFTLPFGGTVGAMSVGNITQVRPTASRAHRS